MGGQRTGRITAALSGVAQRVPMVRDLPSEVSVLAAIAFCVALGFGIVAPAIPLFARTFGVSAFAAGAVVSAFAFVRLIASPGAGALVNRVGERRVLATGLAIVALSSLAAAFAQGYWQLLVLRGLGGFGSTMFTVSALALLLRTVGPDQRGRAAGVYQAGFLFGGVAGPLVGGLVIGISIRAPFLIYAVTLAAATAVTLIWLKDPEPHLDEAAEAPVAAADTAAVAAAAAETADAEAVEAPKADAREETVAATSVPGAAAEAADASQPLPLRTALRDRGYLAALATNLGIGFSIFGLRSALIPLFVVEGLRRGPSLIGIGLLVAAAVQAVLLLPAGRLADTRGRRPAMIIGSAASVVGMLALVVTPNLPLFFASMFVLGVSSAFLGPAPAAVVGDVTHGRPGGAPVALFQMVSDFGAIIGPLVGGYLLDTQGFGAAFAFAAVLSGIGLVAALAMPETLRKQPAAAT